MIEKETKGNKMNKSLEAFFRGYIYFDVNDEKFFLYNSALKRRKSIDDAVSFTGYSIFKGWRTFYLRTGHLHTKDSK
jgi:hypothetical protein